MRQVVLIFVHLCFSQHARECKREIDWWSDSLVSQRKGDKGDTPRKVVSPLPSHRRTDLTDEEVWKGALA